MSLLSTLRPLGGVITITGQTIRSWVGVVLAKCIFENCTISYSSEEDIHVLGSVSVQTQSVIQGGNDYGPAPTVTVNLVGNPTSLEVSLFSYYYDGFDPSSGGQVAAVSLTGATPNVFLGAFLSSGQTNFASDQTAACSVVFSGGSCAASLSNCTNVSVSDQNGNGSFASLDAPNASIVSLNLSGNYNPGGVSISVGCASFVGNSLGSVNTQGTSHYYSGPFELDTVEMILATYAGGSSGGSLTIGGTSASPTGVIQSYDIAVGGSDGGWAVGDTFTVQGYGSGAVLGTVLAVDGDGNPTEVSDITDPADFPGTPSSSAFGKVSGPGTGTYFGTVFTGNTNIQNLLNNGVTVTTN